MKVRKSYAAQYWFPLLYNNLQNEAIVTHCNLRLRDDAQVVICFNYDAHTNVEVSQPICCCLIVFLLLIRYVML